ncbi:MAG: DeoR/GlpR transcriptional regulator [Clostridia bacterium]|nr:DeoR/GlpR transcriptional regulator [Clostridia bacterium]
MTSKERQEQILDILEQQGYVTVKHLIGALQYSSATINRDLNALEKRQLIIRSYGGVEPVRTKYVTIPFRAHKMHTVKKLIGRMASSFVQDGDTIYIDSSTTAQCMEQYLIGKKNLTVITNNIFLAANLSVHDVKVICLGGTVVEAPCMLCGTETVQNASRYRVDKMFFATGAVTRDGLISAGIYDLLFKTIANNAARVFYLVDHNKIDQPFQAIFCDFSEVDCVISDYDFPDETKESYPKTEFVVAKE